jgi:hypothetical protein
LVYVYDHRDRLEHFHIYRFILERLKNPDPRGTIHRERDGLP